LINNHLVAGVLGLNLDCRVHLRRRSAADEEWDLETASLHLLRNRDHLVETRRDETGQTEHVSVVLLDCGQNLNINTIKKQEINKIPKGENTVSNTIRL
jgi:hypothetical protein